MRGFRPPDNGTYYAPTQTASLAAGASATLEFRGLDAKRFGVKAMLAQATDPNSILVSATVNNEIILFQNVHLSILKEMFDYGWQLRYPMVIAENNTLQVSLTNEGTVTNDVGLKLIGYDAETLQAYKAWMAARGQMVRRPSFIAVPATTVSAGSSRQQVQAQMRPYDVQVWRMFVGGDALDKMRIGIGLLNRDVQRDTFADLLNVEFRHRVITVPLRLRARDPIYVYATNTDTVDHKISFLAEVYE